MIVTLDEVGQWCRRALLGAGVPAGIEEDAAAAAVWLAARGLPAVEIVVARLEQWENGPPTAAAVIGIPRDRGSTELDAEGLSALLAGPAVADLVVVQAQASPRPGPFIVRDLSDPLLLVPMAERARRRGTAFRLAWGSAGAVLADRGPALCAIEDAPVAAGAVDVSIDVEPDLSRRRAPAPAGGQGPADLEARRQRVLAHGVAVADDLWWRLVRLGRRALVPASEASRRRGAGAAADGDET